MNATVAHTETELAVLATELEATGQYRVLRKLRTESLEFLTGYVPVPEGAKRGIILDTETTGTAYGVDRIIELCMVLFDFDPETGRVLRVVGAYEGLEDPGMPIPPEASLVNGITDEMVAGKRLNDALIAELARDVELVIAHKAAFDRDFMERRLPLFGDMQWGCSYSEIDWAAEGLSSHKLEYIAYCYGFFYDAHRATADCLAVLKVLSRPLPVSGTRGLKALYDRASVASVVIYAENAPYDCKDMLKDRGYRWTEKAILAKGKAWGVAKGNELEALDEVDWLRNNVYSGGKFWVGVERMDWHSRHSLRGGAFTREAF